MMLTELHLGIISHTENN